MQHPSFGFSFLLRGGFMMIPLLISGLVALTIILERLYLLKKVYALEPGLTEHVTGLLVERKLDAAETKLKASPSPVSAVLKRGIHHLSCSVSELELVMKNEAERWIPILEKRIDVLDTIITAAPLMGLLGTITGMMASFQVLSEKSVGDPNAITGGVAEALIATATGLVIALISLVAYNHLNALIKNQIYSIESAADLLIEAKMAIERNSGKS